jgi:hypothetical protein
VLVPPAVRPTVSVPLFAVFVGATVLLSVLLGAGAVHSAPGAAIAARTPSATPR